MSFIVDLLINFVYFMQEIPQEHADMFLVFYKNAIINLTSIHPSKTTLVFLKYDDFMEDYYFSTNWYEFAKDYGLEHGDQVLFELEAIGGGDGGILYYVI